MVSALDVIFTITWFHEGYKLNEQIIASQPRYEDDDLVDVASFESNPIAQAVFIQYGIEGMLIYKLVLITILVIIVSISHRKHPKIALWLSVFGFVFTGLVAMYGLGVLLLYYGVF